MAPNDLYDSVNPNAIPAEAPAVAGYKDGPESAWPAEGWDRWKDVPRRVVTVLADPDADTFDAESGNASNDEVAGAVAGRLGRKLASWCYSNENNCADLTRALATKSVRWSDASQWPAPGVYLWAADPDGNIASGAWHPPCEPVAVQDRYEGGYDVSTLHVDLTATVPEPAPEPAPPPAPEPAPQPAPQPPAPPAPQPTPEVMVSVEVPVLRSQGGGPFTQPSRPVVVVQLVTGVGADGKFGPATDAAVRAFQQAHGLAADGIVGPLTWARILNG